MPMRRSDGERRGGIEHVVGAEALNRYGRVVDHKRDAILNLADLRHAKVATFAPPETDHVRPRAICQRAKVFVVTGQYNVALRVDAAEQLNLRLCNLVTTTKQADVRITDVCNDADIWM